MRINDFSKKRLVIFDWDGTLYDSTGIIAHSLQNACKALGLKVPTVNEAKHVIGLGFKEAIEHLVGHLDAQQTADFMQAYRQHYFTGESIVTLYDGSLELLDLLKDNQQMLAVATGKSRAGLNRVLNDGQLNMYFSTSRTADETVSKPHPQMLLEILDELEVEPCDAVMIGDTTFDIEMAHAAKISSIAVQYGAHGEQLLLAAKPTAIVESVAELTRLFTLIK